jgi:hypothetical protein
MEVEEKVGEERRRRRVVRANLCEEGTDVERAREDCRRAR